MLTINALSPLNEVLVPSFRDIYPGLVYAPWLFAILGYQMVLTSAVETRRVDGVHWMVQIDDSAIMQIDGAVCFPTSCQDLVHHTHGVDVSK